MRSLAGSEYIDSANLNILNGQVEIADTQLLLEGTYSRSGNHLTLEGQDGNSIQILDYFSTSPLPQLISSEGHTIDGETVDLLAGPLAAGQIAQIGTSSGSEPIGQVETLSGQAFAQRTDGTEVELNVGGHVFQGDVLRVSNDSTLGITFADKTVMSIEDGARIVLNEMVYSPSGSDNSMLFSLVQGAASFITGAVPKSGDMEITTPVAVMAIRGTTLSWTCQVNPAVCDVIVPKGGTKVKVGDEELDVIDNGLITRIFSSGNSSQIADDGRFNGALNNLQKSFDKFQERAGDGQTPVVIKPEGGSPVPKNEGGENFFHFDDGFKAPTFIPTKLIKEEEIEETPEEKDEEKTLFEPLALVVENEEVDEDKPFDNVSGAFGATSTAETIVGIYGSLQIFENGDWVYILDDDDPDTTALNEGDNPTESFTVTSDDGTEHTIEITVNGVNDPAVIAGADTGSVTEDNAIVEATGKLTSSDVDNTDDTFTAETIIGTYGSLQILEDGNWTYTLSNSDIDTDGLGAGDNPVESFPVTSVDGTPHVIEITILGANDAPSGTDKTITIDEDGSHTFAATDFGFSDTDGDELASVIITALPGDGTLTLQDGDTIELVEAGDVIDFLAEDAPILVFKPDSNASSDSYAAFTFQVVDDGSVDANSVDPTPNTMTIDVTPVVDAPDLSVSNASGKEDAAIALDIASSLKDTDGSETLSLVVSGIPDGAVLSDGNGNSFKADTTITQVNISGWELETLKITPPEDSDVDFTLTVTATATETTGDDASTTSDTIDVDVDAVLDEFGDVTGNEGTESESSSAQAVNLGLTFGFTNTAPGTPSSEFNDPSHEPADTTQTDTDLSESVTSLEIVVTGDAVDLSLAGGAPAGAALVEGPGGTWTLTVTDPADWSAAVAAVQADVPAGFDGVVNGSITAITEEANMAPGAGASGVETDDSDNIVTDTETWSLNVTELPPGPTVGIDLDTLVIKEDNSGIFTVTANSGDATDELTAIDFSDLPTAPGWIVEISDTGGAPYTDITGSIVAGDYTYTPVDDATSVTLTVRLTPPEDTDVDAANDISVTATAQDKDGGTPVTSSVDTIDVDVDAVLDEFGDVTGNEGTESESSSAQAVNLGLTFAFTNTTTDIPSSEFNDPSHEPADTTQTDTDLSESVTSLEIVVTGDAVDLSLAGGAPAGAALVEGPGGTWTLTVTDPADWSAAVAAVQADVPAGFDGVVNGSITAITEEANMAPGAGASGVETDDSDNIVTDTETWSLTVVDDGYDVQDFGGFSGNAAQKSLTLDETTGLSLIVTPIGDDSINTNQFRLGVGTGPQDVDPGQGIRAELLTVTESSNTHTAMSLFQATLAIDAGEADMLINAFVADDDLVLLEDVDDVNMSLKASDVVVLRGGVETTLVTITETADGINVAGLIDGDTVVVRSDPENGIVFNRIEMENVSGSDWSITRLGLETEDTSVITGDETANTLNGTASSDFLFGFSEDDFLIGGQDENVLVGGLGSDTFVIDIDKLDPTIFDVIVDYSGVSGDGDIVDLTALFVVDPDGGDPNTDQLSDFVKLSQTGGSDANDDVIQILQNGGASTEWVDVATLEGGSGVNILYNLDGVDQQETITYTV